MLCVKPPSLCQWSGAGNVAAQRISQLTNQIKVLLLLQTATGNHQNISIFNALFLLLLGNAKNLGTGLELISCNANLDDFTLGLSTALRRIHNLITDSSQLRSGVRCQNLSHNVTAKSRTNLYQISIFMNIQNGAVCGQTSVKSGSNSRSQLAAYRSGTYQNSRRLNLVDKCLKGCGIGLHLEILQLRCIYYKNLVCTVMKQFFSLIFNITANKDCIYRMVNFFGKLSGLTKQLEGYRMDFTIYMININSNTLPQRLINSLYFFFHKFHCTRLALLDTELAQLTACIDFQLAILFLKGIKWANGNHCLNISYFVLMYYQFSHR